MWLDDGRFDLLTNQRRLTPPATAARIDQLIEARACAPSKGVTANEEVTRHSNCVLEDGSLHGRLRS
jgi:hypothetical protein